jgi:hypothetical protein
MIMSTSLIDQDLQAQRDFLEQLEFDYDVVVGDAFVRGIRDLGYRNSARAVDELIDNAIQAGADKIAVCFGFGEESDAKPADIAVVDNGHGMDPPMLRLSVAWGGTHRENDRSGFGRYGWGLPSASVSMGMVFSIYSIVGGGQLHRVTMNLHAIARGEHSEGNKIRIPVPEPDQLPTWLTQAIAASLGSLDRGTAVVVSDLDKITWKTVNGLERNLLQHIGLMYRNFLRDITIFVNGKRVEPIDPLFITPGFRFYDLDEDRAEALEPLEFEVKDPATRKPQGRVKVRFSSMPATFARVDKMASPRARNNNNARLEIMSQNNGIIVLREGRQIDVVAQRPWLTVNNDDRYWGVEIDMPATLDEEMSITTSKQQIVLSERMWELLRQHGVLATIRELRSRYDDDTAQLKLKLARAAEDEEARRASEQAMKDAEKFTTRKPVQTRRKQERSQEALEQEVRRRAEESGVPAEQIQEKILSDAAENPFRVRQEKLPGAPFYRAQSLGGQRILWINTAHRFFNDVYASPDSTNRSRAALEVLLFAIAATELDANDERQMFYEMERGEWSGRLSAALRALEEIDSARDARLAQSDADERLDSGEAGALSDPAAAAPYTGEAAA